MKVLLTYAANLKKEEKDRKPLNKIWKPRKNKHKLIDESIKDLITTYQPKE